MKKIIIANNNMKVGGVQKSLCNLLWEIHDQYDITLVLFDAVGEYIDEIPKDIRVKTCKSLFRYLGISQAECCDRTKDRLQRGALAALCRIAGRKVVMPLIEATQQPLMEEYDCAISYLQNGSPRHFYGGVNEFVLYKTVAKKKIAFLHCDYKNCGSNAPENNLLYAQFDQIAACSEGCKQSFMEVVPELSEKCVVVPNCHRYENICNDAQENPVEYDNSKTNILIVARLSHEKGVDRAIRAVAAAVADGFALELHIVGNGAKEPDLKKLVHDMGVEAYIHFYGEQKNPYRYMVHADLLWITSYHEAAPMVIEEAACLGIPTLSVRTTSSKEMIEDRGFGWVCDNTQDGIEKALRDLLCHQDSLLQQKEKLKTLVFNNDKAKHIIRTLLED